MNVIRWLLTGFDSSRRMTREEEAEILAQRKITTAREMRRRATIAEVNARYFEGRS